MTKFRYVRRWIEVGDYTLKTIEDVRFRSISVGLKGYYGGFAEIHPREFNSYIEHLNKVVECFPSYFKALEDMHIIKRMPDGVEDVGNIEDPRLCDPRVAKHFGW